MGCSPSHAVIINSSPTHETICLQPRIYMVSESTLCLLRDVGELRVYNVDETDPSHAVEKFQGAQEQLQNPLLFHPQLRRRERITNADELQSLAGTSSVGRETTSEEIKDNVGDRIEISANSKKHGDDLDDGNHSSAGEIFSEDFAAESSMSPNAHAVTVEVYSYKTSTSKSNNDDEGGLEPKDTSNTENSGELLLNYAENEMENGATAAVRPSEEKQASKKQTGIEVDNMALDEGVRAATNGWTETRFSLQEN